MNREPLNILLVEDDEDDAFYIKDLIREGMPSPLPRVDHTSTAAEAESRLERNLYDLCLFDYRLGEVDGIDLLRTVRGRNITVPIILLTGQGDQEIAVEAMKAGATDYLTKSKLSTETLTHSIRYALGLHREAERRKETEKMLKESHEELKVAHEELQASMRKLQTAQKQILRSEKLAGIGRLAAGVCHEILNPLNIISGHIQALAMEREDDGSLMDDLNSIMEEVQRIEKIISGLLKFSRKGDMELKHMDINKELESVLSILEKDMNLDGVQVFRQFDPDLPPLLADGDRMRQVFLNLISNAKHAMENGGILTVTTQVLHKDSSRGTSSDNGKITHLRIKFQDTGSGIRREDMGRIFDPFFTTKPEDKGTGLGLSVCYSIIEKHGGSLEVESEPGKGSTFIIELPVSQKQELEPMSLRNEG